MKRKGKFRRDLRRGISIVEVAVALAVVMIVSAAAASLVSAASDGDEKAVHTYEIGEYTESVLECFRWANDDSEFEVAVDVLGFSRVGEQEGETGEHMFAMERSGLHYDITWIKPGSEHRLKICVTDQDGEVIYEAAYEE